MYQIIEIKKMQDFLDRFTLTGHFFTHSRNLTLDTNHFLPRLLETPTFLEHIFTSVNLHLLALFVKMVFYTSMRKSL